MKFLMVFFAVCASLAFAAGQFFFGPPPPPNFQSFPSGPRPQFNFGQQPNGRDPRQNRGPVVFPPSPPDAIEESSGVVIGASGYGFVPPQQRRRFRRRQG